MTTNPYVTLAPDTQTTVLGVIGEGLKGVGYFLPPPFNFIVIGLGFASTCFAWYVTKGIEPKGDAKGDAKGDVK